MARSEKLLLALASLFFAGTFGFGFLGMITAQYRFIAVKDAETKLYQSWLDHRHQMLFLEPESLPEFRRILVPGTQASFAVNRNLIGTRYEDCTFPDRTVALYEPHPGTYHGMRSVVFLDGYYKDLSPEKWEKARRESGIVESPPALRPWWKFWQSGPREFFPREAFAAACTELWLSVCVLNAISLWRRGAGVRLSFGRFFSLSIASIVIGIAATILFGIVFRL